MEDFTKKSNFDRSVLYYSAPKEIVEEPVVKSAIPQVETYNSSNRKYSCITCKKRFFTTNALNNHIITHSPDDPIDTNPDYDITSDWKNRYTQNKGIRCRRGKCNFNALDTVEYSKHCKTCEGTRYTTGKTNAFCESCDNYFSSDHHQKIHSVLFHSNNQGITLADNDLEGDHLSEYLLIHFLENDIQKQNVSLSKCRDLSKSNTSKSDTNVSIYSLSNSSHKENNKASGGSLINEINNRVVSNVTESNIQDNTIDSVSSVEVLTAILPDVNLADIKRGTLENSENKSNNRIISKIVETSITSNVRRGSIDRDLVVSEGGGESEFEVDSRKNSVENNVDKVSHIISGNREFVVADSTFAIVGETSRSYEVDRTPIISEELEKTSVLACTNPDEINVDRINNLESIAQKTVLSELGTCQEQQQRAVQSTDLVDSEPIVFDALVGKTSEFANCRGTSVEINTDRVNDTIKIIVDPGVREPVVINLSLSAFTQSQHSVESIDNLKTRSEIELAENFEKMSNVDESENIAGDNLNPSSENSDTSRHVDSLKPLSKANDASAVVLIPNSDKTSNKLDPIVENSNPASEHPEISRDAESSKPLLEVNEASSTVLISNLGVTSNESVNFEIDEDHATNRLENISTDSNNRNLCQMNDATSQGSNTNGNVESKSHVKCSTERLNSNEIRNDVSGDDDCNEISIIYENTSIKVSCDKNAELDDSQENISLKLSDNEKSSSSLTPDSHNTKHNLDNSIKAVKHNSLPEKRIRKIKKLADDFTLLMDSNPELRARIMPKDRKKKDDQKNETKFSRSTPKNKPMEKLISDDGKNKKSTDRKSESKSPCTTPKSNAVEKKISPEVAKKQNTSFVKSKEKKISPKVTKVKNISSDKLDERKTLLSDSKRKKPVCDKSSQRMASREDSAENKKRMWLKKRNLVQENLMVAQRSVRQRKKLVLPDFDYGVEGKQDADDTDDEPKKFTYFVNNTPDPPYVRVERRGRPRKQTVLEKTPVEPVNVTKSSNDTVRTEQEKRKRTETDGEEFCLNSTINEADSFTKTEELMIEDQEEDDSQNELHSWLKQVDFSEQSPFDSWSPDDKLKAQKKMKNKLKLKRNVVVAKPAFMKKTPQLLVTNKPPGEVKKPVTNVQDLLVESKKEKIQNADSDKTKNKTLLNETTVLKKRPGRPRKSIVSVGSDATRPKNNKMTVVSEKDSQSAEVGTQTNVHMLKSPLEVKDIKRVPKKKLPFDPDSNTGQIKTSPKKKSPSEERVNLEPTLTKRIPKRKIPFDPDGEPELIKKRRRKKKLTLERQLEDPMKRRKVKDRRKLGRGRPKNELISFSKNVRRSANIISNRDKTAIDETNVKKEIKAEKVDEKLEIKKEEDLDIIPEMHDHNQSVFEYNSVPVSSDNIPNITMENQSTFENDSVPVTSDNTPNTSIENQSTFEYDSVPETSDNTANTTMELSESNENDTVQIKKRKPRKKLSIMKPKDDTTENGNTSDEMKKIDEDLYRSDVRNKSRYSRNFKKQPGCLKEQESMNDIVTCGRCKKKMTRAHYLTNHEISHYYLSWLEGEPEINLNDDNEMIKIMQSYISSDALRKKAIRLSCEQCDKVMKSVIGYVSHVRFCQKTDERELLERCTLCGKTLKPSSIRHHYVKYHGISKFTFGTDGRMLPDLSSADVSRKNTDSSLSSTMKNGRMGIERVLVEKTDILRDEVFWTNLKTSYDLYMCMGLSCKHMTLSKDDLKTHILSCGATFCEFSCAACSFRTKYENEIIYHSKKKCKETSDVEDNEQPEKEEPASVTATASVSDRRVSTRIKKRKYVIDYEDIDDDDHRKKRRNVERKDLYDDYKLSEIDTESSDDSGSECDHPDSAFRSKYLQKSAHKKTEDTGLRRAFLSYCGSRPSDSLNWTVEVRLKTFSAGPVHEHLKVNMNEWETVSISDSVKYTPIQHKSPNVTFDRQSFSQYDIFQSAVVKGVPLCYTGGPVWSMAWAPLPAHIVEQYLAVASLQDMNQKIKVDSPVEFPAMVQIWKFSSIDNISNDIRKPTLAWAISHSYGAVWSMEWCPTGGFDNSSKPVRLGIIALGTSSGCVVIYSVPRLDCVGDKTGVVANPEPDLLLKVRSDNVQCTRIVWQRNYLPNIIFGGFSDGSIALWNVSTTSPILKKDKVIYPFRSFEAHTSAITALDVHWVDSGRFFLTGSIDRPIKYWDMEDLSGPMYEHDKSALVLSAAWMHHWAVSAQGYDYFSQVEPAVYISHPRDIEKRKSILNINDSIWSVAYSDWNDAVALSSNGGFVSVFSAKHLAIVSHKTPDFDKIITQTDLVPMRGNEKNVNENGKSTDDPYDYATITKDNGIFFDDRIKEKPDANRMQFEPDRSNVLSINKVSWNNNYNNFNWLAVGYDCGFVRVIRVERYDKHHLTKFYKMNENSSIKLL